MSVLQIFRGDDFLEEIVLSRAVMGLGRHPQNDIVLDDRSLSRFHARVERRGDRFVVVDCGAQNGVHLNGERVVGESDLAPGDRITLGRYVAIFDAGAGRVTTPPRNELKAAPPAARNGGESATRPPLKNAIDDLDLDVDMDADVEKEPEDRTKKARPKEIQDFDKTAGDARKKPEPTLVLLFNGMEVSRHPVEGTLIVGRSKQSDVVISLLGLSRKHARIIRTKDGNVTVEDLGSQNGTWVNNQRIAGQKKLKHGDLLNFYDYAVLFLEDGDVEVALPGAGFAPPTGTDELAMQETGRAPASPGKAPSQRPSTGRGSPIADSAPSAHGQNGANGHSGLNGQGLNGQGHNGQGHNGSSNGAHNKNAMLSQSELVDLGEGSFLGDEFEEEASGKNQSAGLSGSLLEEDPLDDDIDDIDLGVNDLDADLRAGLDADLDADLASDLEAELEPSRGGATDIVEGLDLGSALKKDADDLDLDGAFAGEGFDDISGTDGDVGKFEDKTSNQIGGERGGSWASESDLLKALSNSPDTVLVTLEVTMGGKPYTQMPLSQTVTRVGTDARCELSLPKTSGLMPWHMTLLHMGGAVVLYRAAKTGRIQLAENDVDMATLRDGDLLDLGKVRVKVRVK